jgi:hypothetical protein
MATVSIDPAQGGNLDSRTRKPSAWRNDIGEQMRHVARGMTAAEIGAASAFYADLP